MLPSATLSYMDGSGWLELCYRALGVPDLPDDQDRRRTAERHLLREAGIEADILGIGAAEVAIDLVVRYGREERLGEILLPFEQAEYFGPEIEAAGLSDVGTERAILCTKALLRAVVRRIEEHPAEIL